MTNVNTKPEFVSMLNSIPEVIPEVTPEESKPATVKPATIENNEEWLKETILKIGLPEVPPHKLATAVDRNKETLIRSAKNPKKTYTK